LTGSPTAETPCCQCKAVRRGTSINISYQSSCEFVDAEPFLSIYSPYEELIDLADLIAVQSVLQPLNHDFGDVAKVLMGFIQDAVNIFLITVVDLDLRELLQSSIYFRVTTAN